MLATAARRELEAAIAQAPGWKISTDRSSATATYEGKVKLFLGYALLATDSSQPWRLSSLLDFSFVSWHASAQEAVRAADKLIGR